MLIKIIAHLLRLLLDGHRPCYRGMSDLWMTVKVRMDNYEVEWMD